MNTKKLSVLEGTSKDEGDKVSLSFVASTGTPDRMGDIVSPRGWDLANYQRNPIVLLNHNPSELPIGRGNVRFSNERLWKDRKLLIDIDFDMNDPASARIGNKVKNGFLNAVSVGFNPKGSVKRGDLEEAHWAYTTKGGMFFDKAELLEVSVVSIPANPEATVLQSYTPEALTQVIKTLLREDYLSQIDPVSQLASKILHIEEVNNEIIIRLKNSEQTKRIIKDAFPMIDVKKVFGFNHYLIAALTNS